MSWSEYGVGSQRYAWQNMRLKDVTPQPGEKVWAQCVAPNSAKHFFAKTEDAMWEHMQPLPRYYSEVVQDAPCHLFFDLDDGDVHATWARMEPLVNRVLDAFGITYHHVVLDASQGDKKSLHVITRGNKFVLSSPIQGKQFVQHLESIFDVDLELDTSIYTRNRCFRMLGSTKFGSTRVLRGAWNKEFWLQTLVQPTSDLQVVPWMPKHVPRSLHEGTDMPDCVRDVLDHVGAVKRLRMPMSWTWTGQLSKRVCKIANRVHHSNNNYYVFHLDRGSICAKCHACEGRWKLPVPDELMQACTSFLRTSVEE